MKPKIGYSVNKELTEYPTDFFDRCLDTGIEYVEISRSQSLDTAKTRQMIEFLKHKGMKLWSSHIPFGGSIDISSPDNNHRENAVKSIIPLIRLAGEYNIKKCIVHPSCELIKTSPRDKHKKALSLSLKSLCDAAESSGTSIAVENLPRFCLGNSAKEMLEIMEFDKRALICCDVNHISDPINFIEICKNKIITTHISDFDGIDERHWLPGEGIIDFTKLFAKLLFVNYNGVYLLETRLHKDGSVANPEQLFNSIIQFIN